MKICFPVESDKGLESEVFGHFGSAPLFVVFDTKAQSTDTISNQDLGHVHGMCNPLKALDGKMVDIIIVGGIGAGAINKLNKMGIKVYKALKGTVQDNIKLFESNTMPEMTLEQTCGGHTGGCGHL
ncbi:MULTISPECIES: NifB/NifX family molybdenum-iron cluster-binding protein [Desulfobacula]|uniref:Predicted dinitrogen iron-molybdenum cofactor biosynthesis protein n=2 Tax=Desulfobacula TaxID=28222 RepID=K0NEA7_DESTT|nr:MULTISPECIES: NifB/NifX family molybdenum-iron cluster-binding protein [Desulfobacula]CCK79195.1 predicted dinitrogen iron-molybdenum cofactor biosynthesis protein [Desulfobacula toluolica Tol2]SDU04813.1 Predicted Fe-Mo cluster-binding protein, NifX family [Desulfobacula phenolica]